MNISCKWSWWGWSQNTENLLSFSFSDLFETILENWGQLGRALNIFVWNSNKLLPLAFWTTFYSSSVCVLAQKYWDHSTTFLLTVRVELFWWPLFPIIAFTAWQIAPLLWEFQSWIVSQNERAIVLICAFFGLIIVLKETNWRKA